MAVEVISKIKPKDNMDFFLLDSTAVEYEGDSLDIVLQQLSAAMTEYLLTVDYDKLLKFNTNEIISGPPRDDENSARLNVARLNLMLLNEE